MSQAWHLSGAGVSEIYMRYVRAHMISVFMGILFWIIRPETIYLCRDCLWMVLAEVLERAKEHGTLSELRDSYKGVDKNSATHARRCIDDLASEDSELYLLNVSRQLPRGTSLSDLWVALYCARLTAGGLAHPPNLPPKIRKLMTYEFPLSTLMAGGSSRVIPTMFAQHGATFSSAGFVQMFQVHNADVSLDPGPKLLRKIVAGIPNPEQCGGLMIAVLFVASGRSLTMAKLVSTDHFSCVRKSGWSQETVNLMRTVAMQHKGAVKFAEGSTSEVVRTAKATHINYGYHSDWIRELIDSFGSHVELLADFMTTYRALTALDNVGSLRGVHITMWLFCAYNRPIHVSTDDVEELFGPNVVDLRKQCKACDIAILDLYKEVKNLLPVVCNPVFFEIWSCKFENFVHCLNMHKQPSLCWRRHLLAEGGAAKKRRTLKGA